MKKIINYYWLLRPISNWQKLLRNMKLTVFLLFFGLIGLIAGPAYSQNTKISLDMKNAPISSVLNHIEEISEFYFLYNSKLIDVEKKVDIVAKEEPIRDILTEILPTNVTFIVSDKQIVLSPIRDLSANSILQQSLITGTVTDRRTGESMPGVNITIKGTVIGTQSDVSGKYSINIPGRDASLIFSFIGYSSQEIQVGSNLVIDVQLEPEIMGLEEVVVIGYGTVKKSDLTGSVGSVKGNDISVVPTANAMQSLAGRTPGVYVMQNAGDPGAGLQLQIRGANSIQGSNEPLYVIDGFLVSGSNINMLNSSDIERIEILKDASATAIYGSRGANGVVVITTKQGRSGKSKIDFESYYGFQVIRKKIDLMNATEYANFYNEVAVNDGIQPYFTQEEVNGFGKGYDWQDLVFRTAPILNNTLTISGGGEKTRFSFSGSVMDQQGIIKGSSFERYSLRSNIIHEINDIFSFEHSTILTKSLKANENSQGGDRGNSLLGAAIVAPPTLTPYNADGTYRRLATEHSFLSGNIINPLNFLNEDNSISDNNTVLTNLAFIFEPLEGLVLKISGGLQNAETRIDAYRTLNFINSQGSASVSMDRNTSLLNENTLSYNKTIKDRHSISAVAGYTYQDFVNKSLIGQGSGFLSDVLETYNLSAASNPGIPGSGYSKSVLLSYLGRVNYSYDNRYLFTASLRADGSSKYSEGNKWGYFPSFAFAWKLKQESFLKDNEFINDLKLRTSWGVTGSQAINAYQTLTQLSSGLVVFGDALYPTFAPGFLLPGDLKWESTEQLNLGVDIAFLNDRFSLSADFYLKNTYDLLNAVGLPSSLGYTSTIKNVGEIRNKGVEFLFDAKILTGNFRWDLSGNIAINRNEVIKLYEGQDIYTGNFSHPLITERAKILREGEPLGVFYGYLVDGYDNNGLEKYKDIEEDGIINELDKTIIGNPNPDLIYGLSSNMVYKNFDLSFFIQGTYGNDIINVSGISTIDYPGGLNTIKDVYYNHWTPENTNAKYPKPTKITSAKFSDRQVEDGSFIRLKNIMLSYHIPVNQIRGNFISGAQVYVSGQNLLTLTKYSWWDPEINSNGQQGIDQYSYPMAKTYSFGIKLSF